MCICVCIHVSLHVCLQTFTHTTGLLVIPAIAAIQSFRRWSLGEAFEYFRLQIPMQHSEIISAEKSEIIWLIVPSVSRSTHEQRKKMGPAGITKIQTVKPQGVWQN